MLLFSPRYPTEKPGYSGLKYTLKRFLKIYKQNKRTTKKPNSSTDISSPWILSSPKTFLQMSQRVLLLSSRSGLISHASSYWEQGLLRRTGECHKSEQK